MTRQGVRGDEAHPEVLQVRERAGGAEGPRPDRRPHAVLRPSRQEGGGLRQVSQASGEALQGVYVRVCVCVCAFA